MKKIGNRLQVYEMARHGGVWGQEYSGEQRFRSVENPLIVISDTTLKQIKREGIPIRIIPIDDYPAPPGLRRFVWKPKQMPKFLLNEEIVAIEELIQHTDDDSPEMRRLLSRYDLLAAEHYRREGR